MKFRYFSLPLILLALSIIFLGGALCVWAALMAFHAVAKGEGMMSHDLASGLAFYFLGKGLAVIGFGWLHGAQGIAQALDASKP